MWFKQLQLFQLQNANQITKDILQEKLEALAFTPCLPSLPHSTGWVSPLEDLEDEPLVRMINGNLMMCLQVEEKILPATVIRQELNELVRQMEASESRKLRQKEKLNLKDEIMMSLLPRAFSRMSRTYGYIDTKNNWLIIGTSSAKKAEQFISMFKKAVSEDVSSLDVSNISAVMTHWLKQQSYPSSFAVEKACMLQDPSQENRIIRCQHQNLFADAIQSLIKEGCDVMQLALSWQDRVNFVLAHDFSIRSISFQDEIIEQVKEMEPETRQQAFDADFLIMTDIFSSFLTELLELFNLSLSEKIALTKSAA